MTHQTLTKLTKQDLFDINSGACFFAGGGGGSVDLVNQLIPVFDELPFPPSLIDLAQVHDDDDMAVCAVIGAPDAEKAALNQNKFQFATLNCFNSLQALTRKNFKYVVPVETGSISHIAAMMLSALKGIPVVDGDGAGRAVPSLRNLTFTTYAGIPAAPAVLANDQPLNSKENAITTVLYNNSVDEACRGIIGDKSFGQFAGLGNYVMDGEQTKRAVVPNMVSTCLALGRQVRLATGNYAQIVQDFLMKTLKRPSWVIATGVISDIKTATAGGFDLSTVTVLGDKEKYFICSQNENLVTWREGDASPLVIAPDLTSYLTVDGLFKSNADLQIGMRVHVIASPCDEKLRTKDMVDSFMALAKGIGYFGCYVPVEKRLGSHSISAPAISSTISTKSLAKSNSPFPPTKNPLRKIHLRIIMPVLFNQDFLDEFRAFYQTYNRPNVDLDFTFLEEGARPYLISDYDNAMVTPWILRCVQQAMRDKVDGCLVVGMFDTGVIEGKHLANIPVMGPLNACVGLAQNISGNKFGVVCISDREVRVNYRLAKMYQYLNKFAGAIPLNVPVMDLAKDWEYTLLEGLKAARQLVSAGADTILLGCTGMLGLADRMTQELGGIPVLDGVVVGLYMLEDEVRMGLTQSKAWYDYPENPNRMDKSLPVYPLFPTEEELKQRQEDPKKFEKGSNFHEKITISAPTVAATNAISVPPAREYKLMLIVPITNPLFNDKAIAEARSVCGPDVKVDLVQIKEGTSSIESRAEEYINSDGIIKCCAEAQARKYDGVYVFCFGR